MEKNTIPKFARTIIILHFPMSVGVFDRNYQGRKAAILEVSCMKNVKVIYVVYLVFPMNVSGNKVNTVQQNTSAILYAPLIRIHFCI